MKLSRPPVWCTLLGCGLVLAARRPDMVRSPQFWAEDGTVFFLQAHTLGAAAFLEPYAGYFHTLLRLVAWLASWFDPVLAPAFYGAAAGAMTLYVAARTQSARFPLPPSVGYAFAVVLVPDAFEVLLNLTNLQWVLAGGLLLVLIAREPERPHQRWHDGVATGLLGLTGPFSILLLPLFLWRAASRRTRFSTLLAGIAGATACIQIVVILRGGLPAAAEPVATQLALAVPGVRIGGSILSGGHWGVALGPLLATALGVATFGGVAWLAGRPGAAARERRMLGLAFACLLAAGLYRCRHVLPALFHGAGARYFFPPQLILLWLLVALAASVVRWRAALAWSVLALFAAVNFGRWREPAFHDLNWPDYAGRIRRGERVVVRINPDWDFVVPGRERSPGAETKNAPSRDALVNVSTRCRITPEKPALVGFALRAASTRTLLVRAVGPSLAQFGVGDALRHPEVTLRRDGVEDAAFQPRRNGANDPALRRATRSCQAFELQPGAADLVGLVTLPAGLYSLTVSTTDPAGGEVLVEVYEVPPDGLPVAATADCEERDELAQRE